MKRLRLKWKYLLASILLASNVACSNDDLAQIAARQEQGNVTRTADWFSKTIVLETAGTLEAKLTEAMGDTDVATLEKLVVSGPFTAADMNYVRNTLTGLVSIDLYNARIKASDEEYWPRTWKSAYFEDDIICNEMFFNMALVEIILPSTIKSIEEAAFESCDSLKNITIPDGVKVLNNNLFQFCTSLSDVVFPANLEEINNKVFANCTNLKNVRIPETVKNIGDSAFETCDSLISVTLPDNLVSLGRRAFRNCKSLTFISIPNSIKRIEESTFYNCPLLSHVELPSNLEYIGGYAFSSAAFSSIDLPSTLKEISGCAFEYCGKLTSIDLPYGLEKIGGHAFYGCHNLRLLIIPETVTFADNNFGNYCGVRAVIWNPAIDVPSFGSNEGCLLYVNTDQIGVNDVNNWSGIIINGEAISTVDVDGNSEFYNYKEFKAKKLVYSRNFNGTTTPGRSSGWDTIVLPFTPDSIYHETKGQIAPFNSGIAGAKPFWLRELTSEGFVDVTKIEANKPYIIAMPNHGDYLDEYCLNGKITFVARNSELPVTSDVTLEPSIGPDYELHPTYKNVESSPDIYTLGDIGDWYEENHYYYQQFFVKNSGNSAGKFKAYATPLGGGRSSRKLFDLDTRSKETRAAWIPNNTGIPQIGDM